jgi:hypothetical protein
VPIVLSKKTTFGQMPVEDQNEIWLGKIQSTIMVGKGTQGRKVVH